MYTLCFVFLLAGFSPSHDLEAQTPPHDFERLRSDTTFVTRAPGPFREWSDSRGITSPTQIIVKDGTVMVLDQHSMQVWVLDDAGRELGSFGREGPGPGEFRRLSGGAISDDGRYWIYDQTRARLSVWSPEFELIEGYRVVNPSVHGSLAVIGSGTVAMPAAGYEPEVIRVREVGDAGTGRTIMPRSAPPEISAERPMAVDLVTASDGRVTALENATGLLSWAEADTGRLLSPRAQLPASIRTQLDELLSVYQREGFSPTTYAIGLHPRGVHGAVVTLVRALDDGVVGVIVDRDRTSLITVSGDGPPPGRAEVRSIAPLGECFLFSTGYGVERFCPVR